MGRYTTQLRHTLELMCGMEESPSSYTSVDMVINGTWDRAFGSYPIFDEKYRKPLNMKILRHFYMHEIGFETEGQFLYQLNRKMNEIMPYYNRLYETELLDLDPWVNTNYVEKYLGHGVYGKEFTHGHTVGVQDSSSTQYGKTVTGNGKDTSKGSSTSSGDTSQTYGKKTVDSGSSSDRGTKSGEGENLKTLGLSDTTTQTENQSGIDERTIDRTGSNGEKNTNNTQNLNLYLDTPEGNIQGLTNKDYLTDARKITGDVTGQKTGEWEDHSTDGIKYGKTTYTEGSATHTGTDKDTSSSSETHEYIGTSANENTQSGTDRGTHSDTGSTTGETTRTSTETQGGSDRTQGQSTTEHGGTDHDTGENTDDYIKEIVGRNGVDVLDVLEKLRKSFWNIDMMVINELDILFMQIW